LIENPTGRPGSVNHLGVEVETTEQVADAQRRLTEAGLETTTEDEVTCCYAVQDKVWLEGPGGEPWEIYTVLADAEVTSSDLRSVEAGDALCCADADDPSQAPRSACC
jgi:hypothetical protein